MGWEDTSGDKVSQRERSVASSTSSGIEWLRGGEVTANDYRWLCYYTVSRRAAREVLHRSRAHVLAEANFHQMYITFFSACKDKKILFQQALGLFADPNTTDIVN